MWYKADNRHFLEDNVYLEEIGTGKALQYKLHTDDKGEKFLVGDFRRSVRLESYILFEKYEKAPYPIRELWHHIRFGKEKYLWDEGSDCVYIDVGIFKDDGVYTLSRCWDMFRLESIELKIKERRAKISDTFYYCKYVEFDPDSLERRVITRRHGEREDRDL